MTAAPPDDNADGTGHSAPAAAVARSPMTDTSPPENSSKNSALGSRSAAPIDDTSQVAARSVADTPSSAAADQDELFAERAEPGGAQATQSAARRQPTVDAHGAAQLAAELPKASAGQTPRRADISRHGQFARWREILYMLVQRDLKARSKQA